MQVAFPWAIQTFFLDEIKLFTGFLIDFSTKIETFYSEFQTPEFRQDF